MAEDQVDAGHDQQGEQRRDGEAADHRDRQRRPQLVAGAEAERHRQETEHGRGGGHQDRPQPLVAGAHQRLDQRLPLLAPAPVHGVDEDDGVVDDDAGEHHRADQHQHRQRVARDQKRGDDADQRQRHRGEDDQRVEEGLELRGHDHVDQEDRQQQGEAQTVEGDAQLLVLTGDLGTRARRQVQAADQALDRPQHVAEVARGDLRRHLRHARAVDAVDRRRAALDRHSGDGRNRHRGAAGQAQPHALDLRGAVAERLGGAQTDVETLLALAELADHLAADLAPQRRADVRRADAERRGAVAVERHLHFGVARLGGGGDVFDPRQAQQRAAHDLGRAVERAEVVGEDAHPDRGLHREHRRPHQLGLGAREAVEDVAHPLDRRRLRRLVGALGQHEVDLRQVLPQGAPPRGSRRETADGGEDALEAGVAEQQRLDALDGRLGGGERRPLREVELEGERALGEVGHQPGAEQRQCRHRGDEQQEGGSDHRPAAPQRPLERPRVAGLQAGVESLERRRGEEEETARHLADRPQAAEQQEHDQARHEEEHGGEAALPGDAVAHRRQPPAAEPQCPGPRLGRRLRQDPAAEVERGERRDQRQRDGERGEEREADGERLVTEELAGDPLDEDDGQEDGHRRQRRGDDRAGHLAGTADGSLAARQPQLPVAIDRLQHDDRGVDQHADPEREAAERHDVERHSRLVERQEGGDHRGRDRQRHDHRRGGVAQEEVENQHRQQAAHPGRVLDLVDGRGDVARLVGENRQVEVRRHLLVELGSSSRSAAAACTVLAEPSRWRSISTTSRPPTRLISSRSLCQRRTVATSSTRTRLVPCWRTTVRRSWSRSSNSCSVRTR